MQDELQQAVTPVQTDRGEKFCGVKPEWLTYSHAGAVSKRSSEEEHIVDMEIAMKTQTQSACIDWSAVCCRL